MDVQAVEQGERKIGLCSHNATGEKIDTIIHYTTAQHSTAVHTDRWRAIRKILYLLAYTDSHSCHHHHPDHDHHYAINSLQCSTVTVIAYHCLRLSSGPGCEEQCEDAAPPLKHLG